MKERILRGIAAIIALLILTAAIVVAYYMFAEIETNKIPDDSYSCNIEQEYYKNRKVFILTPKNIEKTDLTILYFHGGSYMAEITNEHWSFLEKIINDTGATVILPDYPLAPKHNYKDVFNMVEPLYNEIVSRIDTNKFIVMGDSAGGGLALALEEKITESNEYKLPIKTILISPWLDVRLENQEINEVQKTDKQLNKETLKLAGVAYAGEDGINSYLVNPIDGDLSKLNNISIYTGTHDILNPDVHILKQRAEEQGANVEVKEYEGATHIWILKNDNNEKELRDSAYTDLVKEIKTEQN